MNNQEKVEMLAEENKFEEALKITKAHNMEKKLIANVSKQYADFLYDPNNKQGDQSLNKSKALEQYIQTIGYLNPSYVIAKYQDTQDLTLLI